jgi:hypothetical protein
LDNTSGGLVRDIPPFCRPHAYADLLEGLYNGGMASDRTKIAFATAKPSKRKIDSWSGRERPLPNPPNLRLAARQNEYWALGARRAISPNARYRCVIFACYFPLPDHCRSQRDSIFLIKHPCFQRKYTFIAPKPPFFTQNLFRCHSVVALPL